MARQQSHDLTGAHHNCKKEKRGSKDPPLHAGSRPGPRDARGRRDKFRPPLRLPGSRPGRDKFPPAATLASTTAGATACRSGGRMAKCAPPRVSWGGGGGREGRGSGGGEWGGEKWGGGACGEGGGDQRGGVGPGDDGQRKGTVSDVARGAAGVSKVRRGSHREYWLSAWTRGGEGSRRVLRVERRSDDADEGHGHRSRASKYSRELHLPFDRGDGTGEGGIQRKRTRTGVAEGAYCDDSSGTHRKPRGCSGDGGVSSFGGIVVAHGGGDSTGWRADCVLSFTFLVFSF